MPPKGVFHGSTFALCGHLERPAKDVEALIIKHGGEVATSITAKVTHVVSTAAEAAGTTTKIVLAKAKELPIVLEGYLDACVTAKALLGTGPFALAKGAKRKASPASPKRGGKEKPKKVRKAIETTDAVPVLPASKLAGKAAVLLDGKDPCDCELLLHKPDKHVDRFYRLQLLAAPTSRTFHVVRQWGLTGSEGRTHVTKHSSALEARRVFRSKFRQRTGNKWTSRAGFAAVDGKYSLLKCDKVLKAAHGEWYYYLHNEVNGKTVGWYAYDKDPNGEMERLWQQFSNCAALDVRLVQTDYFEYEVDFGNMVQTNRKSGMRRVLCRVAAGCPCPSDAPKHIPEKAAPVKKPEAPPESEDEDEDEVIARAMAESEEDEDDDAEDDDEKTDVEDLAGVAEGVKARDADAKKALGTSTSRASSVTAAAGDEEETLAPTVRDVDPDATLVLPGSAVSRVW